MVVSPIGGVGLSVAVRPSLSEVLAPIGDFVSRAGPAEHSGGEEE